MTPDMKPEALLVSQDLPIQQTMWQTMEDLSTDVELCRSPSRAVDLLTRRSVDLVILDYDEGNGTAEIAKTLKSETCLKTTIAALVYDPISGNQIIEAGAHVLIQKPLSNNFKIDCRNLVYSRMVWERRRHLRSAVRWLVAAKDQNDRPVPVTMEDISRAGVGLSFVGKLLVDAVLTFRLLLPGTNQIIRFDARVLWRSRDNRAGAEFVHISTVDADVLDTWLQSQHRVNNSGIPQTTTLSEHSALSV
jgi:AmiR/NasT family two-component response regulator